MQLEATQEGRHRAGRRDQKRGRGETGEPPTPPPPKQQAVVAAAAAAAASCGWFAVVWGYRCLLVVWVEVRWCCCWCSCLLPSFSVRCLVLLFALQDYLLVRPPRPGQTPSIKLVRVSHEHDRSLAGANWSTSGAYAAVYLVLRDTAAVLQRQKHIFTLCKSIACCDIFHTWYI